MIVDCKSWQKMLDKKRMFSDGAYGYGFTKIPVTRYFSE